MSLVNKKTLIRTLTLILKQIARNQSIPIKRII